jgi:hypothetical protein
MHLDGFAAQLTALVTLHVAERSGNLFESGSEYRYVLREAASPYGEMFAPAHLDESDAAALRRFYATVAARSEALHAA